jgi:anti-sigma factor RsiW
MGRPFDKHIDSQELDALVPSSSESGQDLHRLSPDASREAARHVESCGECSRKVSKYRRLMDRSSNEVISQAAAPGADCPKDEDVDWHEVAAGLWPELKASQLIMHAALCDHCGPLLRAATSAYDDPTPQEEKLLAELSVPSRPVIQGRSQPILSNPPPRWRRLQWSVFVPATALVLIVAVVSTIQRSSPTPLSGPAYAKFAVNTHKQHAQGSFALDVRSDSQQTINEWFKTNSKFSLALPASPEVLGEKRPYRLEGARLLQFGGQTAAYIAYQMQTGPVSLMVTPDSVAVASGGVEVNFKKVTFHYGMVEGYKVVTWSLHGLTYALVSQEGNSTQRSCMVCHSALRDRDLGQTPAPLGAESNAVESVWHSLLARINNH